jgi:hypothetical protein
MWKKIRIFMLLMVLATVAQQTLMEQADLDWKDNFYVAVYPVNADNSAEVSAYIGGLTSEEFQSVADYFAEEAPRYGVKLRRPFELKLGPEVKEIPPAPPVEGGLLQVVIWSLKFRLYAWNNSPPLSVKPDIKLYLLYHNPETTSLLSHSTALNKGRIGRVNVFASKTMEKKNLVVIAHELLHTVNATDKYDMATTLPIYPDGFAAPIQQPLYPQTHAELMGGRVPKNEHEAEIPASLKFTTIGEKTAREIGWVE